MMYEQMAEEACHASECERMLADGVWATRDGRELPVREMTDGHLLNSIRLIERGGSGGFYGYEGEACAMLVREARRRGLEVRGAAYVAARDGQRRCPSCIAREPKATVEYQKRKEGMMHEERLQGDRGPDRAAGAGRRPAGRDVAGEIGRFGPARVRCRFSTWVG